MGKVYIAGPMAGIPEKNRASFLFAHDMLRTVHGMPEELIRNPANIPAHDHGELACPGQKVTDFDPHAAACYYRTDLRALLECDYVVFLPGWERSTGCRLEMTVATACGIQVLFMDMKDGEVYNSQGRNYPGLWWEDPQ